MEIGLQNYTQNIVRYFHKFVESEASLSNFKMLDFGAGTGVLAQIWFENYSIKPDCVEIDAELIQILRKRGFRVFSNLNEINNDYSCIYISNVLEHIEKDTKVLKSLAQKIKYNGKIIIYVPAFPFLFSGLDHKVGHFQRYRKKELLQKVSDSGFSITHIYYSD